jgi:hypothetical protein
LQLGIAKHICSLTFDKEKSRQELVLFKLSTVYHKLPKSLDILEGSLPSSITTISDRVIRERLSNQYQMIIQRTKADLTRVLTSATEAKTIDCQNKFDTDTSEIWKHQRGLPKFEQLPSTMVALIEQRQQNIIDCLKRIYAMKSDFLLKASTTRVID